MSVKLWGKRGKITGNVVIFRDLELLLCVYICRFNSRAKAGILIGCPEANEFVTLTKTTDTHENSKIALTKTTDCTHENNSLPCLLFS